MGQYVLLGLPSCHNSDVQGHYFPIFYMFYGTLRKIIVQDRGEGSCRLFQVVHFLALIPNLISGTKPWVKEKSPFFLKVYFVDNYINVYVLCVSLCICICTFTCICSHENTYTYAYMYVYICFASQQNNKFDGKRVSLDTPQ